ncbi:hypothetical protein AB205_0184290, partial [Aquarana catesbeiana]
MVSFSVNPFSSRNTFEMTGSVGGLSLSSTNGSTIPLKDLTEYIEIMLPRDSTDNDVKRIFYLANLTSVLVNVTSASLPLVIHVEPSQHIPLVLYLGYEYHPNETNYDINFHLPNGKYPGEKVYSWVINPEELFGEGTYYLTLKSDVEDDIFNGNDISVSVTCFTSQCVFWDEINQGWNNTGCH